jgi:uncharacterized integral membrane protein
MSFKTIVIIMLSVLITVIFMQNTDQVLFTILWKEIYVSKLVMMLIVTLFGFILGVIIARPRKKKIVEMETASQKDIPFEINHPEDSDYISMKKERKLSDEDRDYID